jgi:hypothetical protein
MPSTLPTAAPAAFTIISAVMSNPPPVKESVIRTPEILEPALITEVAGA